MARHAYFHQLKPPTLQQGDCPHRWEVTHTRAVYAPEVDPDWNEYPFPKRRYLRCQLCGFRTRSTERLDVPACPTEPGPASALMRLLEDTIADYLRRHIEASALDV